MVGPEDEERHRAAPRFSRLSAARAQRALPERGAYPNVARMLPTHHPVTPVSDPTLPPLADAQEGSSVRRVIQRLRWTLYGVACVVYLFPPMDMLSSILPLHPRDIQWRYQATNLFGQSMLTQTMALTAATLVVLIARHDLGAKIVRMICLLEAMAIVPLTAIFLADFLQIRPSIEYDLRRRLDIVTLKSCFELFVGAVVMAVLWWQLDRSTPRAAEEKRGRRKRRKRVVPNYDATA